MVFRFCRGRQKVRNEREARASQWQREEVGETEHSGEGRMGEEQAAERGAKDRKQEGRKLA